MKGRVHPGRGSGSGGGSQQSSDTAYDVVQVVFALSPQATEAMKRNAAAEAPWD